jgi:hypothetical protein
MIPILAGGSDQKPDYFLDGLCLTGLAAKRRQNPFTKLPAEAVLPCDDAGHDSVGWFSLLSARDDVLSRVRNVPGIVISLG